MPTGYPLTSQDAVEAVLVRPLTDQEEVYIDSLVFQASALLRLAVPAIDLLIARYTANSLDPGAVSYDAVEAVLASVIKQVLVNPNSLTSRSDTAGQMTHSETYAIRSDPAAAPRGVLRITADDLAVLFPIRKKLRAGSIRMRPGLAPRPVGNYGMPVPVGTAIEAMLTFSQQSGTVLMGEIVGGQVYA